MLNFLHNSHSINRKIFFDEPKSMRSKSISKTSNNRNNRKRSIRNNISRQRSKHMMSSRPNEHNHISYQTKQVMPHHKEKQRRSKQYRLTSNMFTTDLRKHTIHSLYNEINPLNKTIIRIPLFKIRID